MACQILHENTAGNSVKCFTKVLLDNIHSLFLTHQAGHLVRGDQVGRVGPAVHEPLSDPLVVLYT